MATASFGQFVDTEQQDIERRRALAQALQQQAMQAPQQQVAGGRVVAQSPVEGIAKLAQALMAGRKNKELDTQQSALNDRKRTQTADEVQAFVKALRGTPAFETGANEMGDETVMQKPVAPDQGRAMAMALGSQNPGLQQVGGSLLAASLPKAPKMERVEIPDGKGGKRVGFVDINSPNPFSTFQEGGVDPAKGIAVNGQIVNPTQMGQTIPKQLDPTDPRRDLLLPDGSGGFKPNAPLIGAKSAVAAAGKPNISSTVINAGPKAFETELGKLDAEQLGKWRSAAEASNGALSVVQNLRNAEAQGAYSGAGADAKLAGARVIETITGITPKGQVGSELYNAESKKLILESIKGLGANPSNADREFIEKTVPQLATSAQARKSMADFMEKKAMTQIQLYQRADKYARENHGLGGFEAITIPPKAAGSSGELPTQSQIDAELARRRGGKK